MNQEQYENSLVLRQVIIDNVAKSGQASLQDRLNYVESEIVKVGYELV